MFWFDNVGLLLGLPPGYRWDNQRLQTWPILQGLQQPELQSDTLVVTAVLSLHAPGRLSAVSRTIWTTALAPAYRSPAIHHRLVIAAIIISASWSPALA
ncbi:hypothetical protein ElyMa_004291400 [Elysia marginata]|uniref:Uncharacterized protein n=1 Tax=Elysia marginata TaxID=1093978 RepID=A0AAV4GWL2_9GAST|nr:hypothetical protein ElyMa_004291400 [Elysia marginata]